MSEIKIGKPDVAPDATAHIKGVHQGNHKNAYKHMTGHHNDGTADARRSTGVSPKHHDAILPIMPNVPPA